MGERKIEKQEQEREIYIQKERDELGVDCSMTNVVLLSGYQRQGGKENDRKRDGLGERERYN